jgi:MerR family transcriptional regulator/heat shock protein HspR
MTNELGLNLAGVERVLDLESKLERAQAKVDALERRAEELKSEVEKLMAARDKLRGELVPLKHTNALVPAKDLERFRIRVERGD